MPDWAEINPALDMASQMAKSLASWKSLSTAIGIGG